MPALVVEEQAASSPRGQYGSHHVLALGPFSLMEPEVSPAHRPWVAA